MQTCTSASKDVEKCRFWRVMYTFGWDVRPRGDPITKKLPLLGAFSSKMAEEEGCPNFERSSKFIRSAYADRAALKTRHWRVFFTLRALAGSNPSSCALLRCAQKEKAPLLGLIPSNGGGGGIRTLVTLYRPNGFRDRRIQPLCHPSAWGKNKAGSKACFGINWRRVRDLNPGDAFDAYTISNRAPSATRTTLR